MKNNLQIVFSTPEELALLEKFKKKVKQQGGKMATTVKVLIKRWVEDGK